MRRFYLLRRSDASGVSGVGKVAEGCEFDIDSMGMSWCALTWLSDKKAMSWYPSVDTIVQIHGHGGCTKVVWIDDESSNIPVNA